MTADLDTLLASPLAPVADDGFSAAVARRALALETRHKLLDSLALLAAGLAVLAALPLPALRTAIETVTLDLGNSQPVAFACAALVLTGVFARWVVDRPE